MIPEFAEFERYDSSMDLVLSCSGGKDSVALGIAFKERGIPFRAVFADTGWEHAATYKYIREVVPELIGQEVTEVRVEIPLDGDVEALARVFETRLGMYSPMVRRCLRNAMFPSRRLKWCTQELKIYPIAKFLDTLDGEPVVVTGVRREESEKRAATMAWEVLQVDLKPAYGERIRTEQTQWRPAIFWTYDDVIQVFHHAGIAPNPLYLAGSNRVGCWPCINTAREEMRLLSLDDSRVSIIRDLELAVNALHDARRETIGTHAWFQARTPTDGRWPTWPIDRAIQWARGKAGSPDQQELFWSPQDGCARWGLCPATGAPKLFGGDS